MTGFEARTTGAIGAASGQESLWMRFLVPVVTAMIVLALGLALVALTSHAAEDQPDASSPAIESTAHTGAAVSR